MTGREKVEAAFSESGTSQFPAVIPYEGIYFRDRWSELTSCPWWYQQDPRIENQVEWRAKVWSKLELDFINLSPSFSDEDRKSIRIEERNGEAYRIDLRTGLEIKLNPPTIGGWDPSGSLASHHPQNPPETYGEIDKMLPDISDDMDTNVDWQGRDKLASAILSGFGKDVYPIMHTSSPLWECYNLWGFEGMMTNILTDPELVKYACRRYLQRSVRWVRRAPQFGVKAIWIEECLTDMIDPGSFGSINVPFLKELTDEIRAAGLKGIYYYCGNPAGKWDHIFDIGFDALALEEGKKGFEIDIEQVAGMVNGRFTLLGNLDAVGVLQEGTDEELEAEIKRQISAGRKNKGRFIMSVGSPVTPLTPVDRVKLYCDLAHEIGSVSL